MTDGRDDDLLGETLAGRYAVLARVARGGFGVVYRGRHVELDAPVAIKVLTATDRYAGDARAEWLAMFQREARTLAALNHPALVRVLDYGSIERNGRTLPWMALEWLEGITLEADLASRRGEGRSPREVLDLMRPAFDALACAHEAGVSHRDIKPSNLMLVAAKRGAPSLRVIDFGVAKIDDSERLPESGATGTDAALVAFSVAYAAPEQVTRTRTGPWTDVHALALVITEALLGARAYPDRAGASLIESVLSPERPTPGRSGLDVGPWEAVLARAMERLPASRPSNAGALWAELDRSVEEAQAAWEASSRPRPAPPPGSSDVTLDGTAPPDVASQPRTLDVTPRPADSTATAVLVASVLPRPKRVPWGLVAAAVAGGLTLFALASSSDHSAQGARRNAPSHEPSQRVATPQPPAPSTPPVIATPAAPSSPPSHEPPAISASARAVTPRAVARRPLRTRAQVDAGAPSATHRAEPRLVLE